MKLNNFIKKALKKITMSITIKLPLINVTLAPRIIHQPSFEGWFFCRGQGVSP